MTALEKYAKLEATARYFDGEFASPRDVVVCFGERSLVITALNDVALAHWPLASLRAIGARGDRAVQLVPGESSDERLVIEDAEMLAAIRQVCPGLYHRKVDRRRVRSAFFWSGAAIASVLTIVFVLVPALAGQLAQMIPPEREQQLGDAVVDQIRTIFEWTSGEAPEMCDSANGLAALNRMGDRLTAGLDLPYPLRLGVINLDMINAVAVPGGRILVFKGLLSAADSPEEVAGVLAHEIGHVAHRDPTREALRAAGTTGVLGLMLGDVFGAGLVVVMTDAILNASYQRDAEERADETAYELLGDAGLPSTPFAGFFEKVRKKYGDGEGVLKLISSHPGLAERAERAAAADRIGDRPFDPVLDDRDWIALKGICQGGMPGVRRGGQLN